MKKMIFLAVMAIGMLFTGDVQAQKYPGLDKSPADIATFPRKSPVVKVVYGRPQLKGRDLETLAPEGKVWRTGANEATEITFYKDVNFGGQDVKAGTYSVFSIPSSNQWTLILNSDLNVWGAYSYNADHDVARVQAKVETASENIEALSVAFTGEESDMVMHVAWGTKRISVEIK
ncbi:DUF2911 domain-containing protein [Flavobacteriaceae bacterium]|nr:DUF2911 domain-containing protein [Flavobacteriaceae bacterium]